MYNDYQTRISVLSLPPDRNISISGDDYTLLYIYEGEVRVRSESRMHYIQPGELFLFHKSAEPEIHSMDHSRCMLLSFNEFFVNQYESLAAMIPVKTTEITCCQIKGDEVIGSFFDFLHLAVPLTEKSTLIPDLKLKMLFHVMAGQLPRHESETLFSVLANGKIKFRATVLANFKNNKVEEIAALCNMSLSAFERKFKKEFNMSPLRWINLRKAEYLYEQIAFTGRSYTDLADELAFCSVAYLSNFVKRYYDLSPDQIRKENHNAENSQHNAENS